MSITDFANLVKGYRIILGAFKAGSEDICVNCINLEVGKTKVEKGLKKLGMDVEKSTISDEEKRQLLSKVDTLLEAAEAIPLASECSCQKSAGNCKIGPGCFAAGVLDLMKLITEPPHP